MNRKRFSFWATFAVLIFFYLPIVMLIITSFNESRFGGVWKGFSLKWYQQLFTEEALWKALRNSLFIGIGATIVSSILGTLAALTLHRYRSMLQKAHYGLVYTPLVIPDVLMGMSLLLFFVAVHLQLGLFTIFIAHTTFCLSYVTFVVLARLQTFDYSLIEAAQDLGASYWQTFWRIKLPLLLPAILSGALLAFTLSIDDFVITFFVAGPGSTTLPIYIYSLMKFGSTPIINALSTVLILATFGIVWIVQTLTREEKV
jgi:spermidine/putrescine transport system permease protein